VSREVFSILFSERKREAGAEHLARVEVERAQIVTTPLFTSPASKTQTRNSAHHGVRISDRALVAAAELSNRYITARFLPDKAIDLIDEAAANQRMQLDSMPEFMDELQRRQLRLRIEEQALSKEKDKASESRLGEVRRELADLRDALAPLAAKYSREKERLDSIRALQKKKDELLVKLAEADRRQDLPLAADLKFGALTEVEAGLKAAVAAIPADSMLSEEVGPEDIAAVVSRWTGIPVSSLTTTQKQKLLRLREQLHERVVGQDAAVAAVADAVMRSRAGLAAAQRGSSFLFLGPTGVGKTELCKALAALMFDDEKSVVRLEGSDFGTASARDGAPA